MAAKSITDWERLGKKIDVLSRKIDKNQKALNQIDDVAKILKENEQNLKYLGILKENEQNLKYLGILKENEQNLKDLGTLKHRLDTLDKIMINVDKIAGGVMTYREQQELNSNKLTKHGDRLEKIEKHLHLPTTP